MEIQNFRNDEFGSLRVIQNEKGEMMFCLADVCKALGIGNPSQMKTRLDDGYLISSEVSTKSKNQYGEFSRTVTLTFIGEPNLYRCIFQSKKEGAKRFQDWVFGEVLPSIRRTGAYMTRDTMMSVLAEPENILRLCRTLVEMQPKADYCDAVLLSDDCMTMTQVAKELGMTCHDLTHYLLDNRVIYAQSGQYMLYADYARMGYMALQGMPRCMILTLTVPYEIYLLSGVIFLKMTEKEFNNFFCAVGKTMMKALPVVTLEGIRYDEHSIVGRVNVRYLSGMAPEGGLVLRRRLFNWRCCSMAALRNLRWTSLVGRHGLS